jgi:hypothetical protein
MRFTAALKQYFDVSIRKKRADGAVGRGRSEAR